MEDRFWQTHTHWGLSIVAGSPAVELSAVRQIQTSESMDMMHLSINLLDLADQLQGVHVHLTHGTVSCLPMASIMGRAAQCLLEHSWSTTTYALLHSMIWSTTTYYVCISYQKYCCTAHASCICLTMRRDMYNTAHSIVCLFSHH